MENLPLSENKIDFSNASFVKKLFSKNKIVFYVLISFISLIFFYFLFFSAPFYFPTENILNIEEGLSLRAISKDLQDKNIIRSRVVFETLAIIYGGEKGITFGDYLLSDKLSVFSVTKRLVNGEKNLAPIKITIPEGFDISDISEVFVSKLSNFNKDKFLLEAKDKEGYLFPDTYFFSTTDTEEDVLSSMSNNFNKKIKSLKSEIDLSGKTEKEIIIMASLIEKESKGDIDRDLISGILWKRISIDMPLQVDAKPDTYKTKGLPESPICNPGLKAIKAAIFPKNSLYLYYLHDKNGNIHYAKNFDEHKLNKQKYLK